MGRSTVSRRRTDVEHREDRRRLHLERPLLVAWRGGQVIAALAQRHLVSIEWVEQTVRLYERGGIVLDPETEP